MSHQFAKMRHEDRQYANSDQNHQLIVTNPMAYATGSQSGQADHFEFVPPPHRSHSPNTTSMAPMIAVTSGSMWPLVMKSIACRCENAVGRILQR